MLLGLDTDNLTWRAGALCAQTDPDLWFPDKGGSSRAARRLCGSCEVRQDCLDEALARDERHGIWGGLTEPERRRLRPPATDPREPRPRRPVAIAHGTESGYKAHRRRGEDACRACLDGLATARAARAARRADRGAA